MRLLHTSDWHLGRTLHRADLSAAQESFLDGLVETVRRERVDAVLVAGDVFDRAVPSVDAVRLYDDALVRLRDAGARVVVTSGNHDSAARLGVGSRLVDAAGVHVRTRPQALAEPVLLEDAHGPVAVYGLPYLEPEAVRAVLPDDPGGATAEPRGHLGVLGRAMACVHADRARRGPRSVVLAHAWVTGGVETDSERDISVGGVGRVPGALFQGISYTALGHLHGPQVLREDLRYSGSPLPYSFSEAAHVKGSWLVELGPDGLARVEQVPSPTPRPLSTLRGRLADLLTSGRHAAVEQHWLSVVLTDPVRPDDPMERLRARFPRVLVLDWQPAGALPDDRTYAARLAGRDDLEVAAEFVRHVRTGGSAPHAEPAEGVPACPHAADGAGADEGPAGALDVAERALLQEALDAGRLAGASA